MQAYLQHLEKHPLRTKIITSGTLQALQEYLASYLTGTKNSKGGYFTDRVIKMSLYGICIQAPLNHTLLSPLQRVFAGRKGISAKVLQIICSSLTVSVLILNFPIYTDHLHQVVPIQCLVLVTFQAIIRGASTFSRLKAAVERGLLPVLRFSWVSSPLTVIFAQNYGCHSSILLLSAWEPLSMLLKCVDR